MKIMLVQFYTPEQFALDTAIRAHYKLGPDDPIPDGRKASEADFAAVKLLFEQLVADEPAVKH
jgi:hypothetical protein